MPIYPDEDQSLYPELPPQPGRRPDSGDRMPPRQSPPEGWQAPPVQRRSGPCGIPEDWGEEPVDPGPPVRRKPPVRQPVPQKRAVLREDAAGIGRPVYSGPGESARSGSGRRVCIFLILLSIAVLAVCGMIIYQRIQTQYYPHRERAEAVYRDTLPQNVFVDNIPVGGLTFDEAAEKLRSSGSSETINVSFAVILPDGGRQIFTEKQIPIIRNTEAVLKEAAAGDRTGMADAVMEPGMSPLQHRYNALGAIGEHGAYYYTRVTYSREDVYAAVDTVSDRVNRQAKDAEVIFDPVSRGFTFTDEVIGRQLDAADLYSRLIFMLDNGIYNGETDTVVYRQEPSVTRADLESTGWGMISTYSTFAWEDDNRNTNILLACRAVNGKEVLPGGVFSFNGATGQRTEEKGYKPAAAIAGGATVDEVGGGVCQVSSTLFNVCAMADLEIVERSPHTWPSTYVEKGRDATVNWPNLDFKFRNNTDQPLYILARFENRKCTVELYGLLRGDGLAVGLETVQISETPPPEEAVYVLNTELPRGVTREKKKARTGYVVETWKVYYRNGQECGRLLLDTSEYKMIQGVIEYNN